MVVSVYERCVNAVLTVMNGEKQMEYRYIGKTGLRVSPLCMGTMTFGSFCDRKTSFAIMDKAYERGVNFFDTAELYPVPPRSSWAGRTEEIVGEWLATKSRDYPT